MRLKKLNSFAHVSFTIIIIIIKTIGPIPTSGPSDRGEGHDIHLDTRGIIINYLRV